MTIKGLLGAIIAMCSIGYISSSATAQVYVAPVVSTPVIVGPAPVVVSPSYTAGYSSSYVAPTYSTLSPVISTSSYSSYSSFSPVVTSAAVVAPAPVVTAPVVTAPVVAYRPVVPTYSVPYVAARPVIVSPKVYVPGEPVRNFFKAVTP